MVNFKNLSPELQTKIKEIKALYESKNSEEIDHHSEYKELQNLLSGKNAKKYEGIEKEYIEGLMIDYQDKYQTTKTTREDVLNIVGKDKKAHNNDEIKRLKALRKGDISNADKAYIKRVIDGKEAIDINSDMDNLGTNENLGQETVKKEEEEKENLVQEPVKKEEEEKENLVQEPVKKEEEKKDNTSNRQKGVVKENHNNNVLKEEITQKIELKNDKNEYNYTNQNTGVIINATNGSNVEVNFGEQDPTKAEKVGEISADGEKTAPKKLTPKEKAEARSYGEQVNDLLTNGFTKRDQQITVSNILRNNINADNVLEFLRGYEMQQSGDPFFEQMMREWDFKEKEGLIRDVAQKLIENLKTSGQTDSANEIETILAKGYLTKEDAVALDKITKRYTAQDN